jgi:hypothetical protein
VTRILWIAGIVALCGAGREAEAQPTPPDLASAQSWIAARIALVKDGEGLPRLDDPVAGPMLRAALDTEAIHAIDLDDLSMLEERCSGPTRWGGAYLAGDAQILQTSGADVLGKLQATPEAASNEIRYIDELTLLIKAGYMCLKRQSLSVTVLYRANRDHTDNEDFRQGLASIRAGTTGMLQGLFMMQADPRIPTANKNALITAVMIEPEDLVGPLNKAQRAGVIVQLGRYFLGANLANGDALMELAHHIEQAPCADLCLLP